MAFRWNVEPYRWLYELRENYTQQIFYSGNKIAYKRAADIEAWMKENAPWTDRTKEERDRRNPQENPGARKGLKVVVGEEQAEDRKLREARMRMARAEDENRLIEHNAVRAQSGKDPYVHLPKRFSAERALDEQMKSKRLPLIRLTMRHRQDLRYAIWLEIGMGGRFAVIGPAMDHWGPILMKDASNIARLPSLRKKLSKSLIDKATKPKESDYQKYLANDPDYTPWSDAVKQVEATRRGERKAQAEMNTFVRNLYEISRTKTDLTAARKRRHRSMKRGAILR